MKSKLPVVVASLPLLFGMCFLQEILISLMVLCICIRRMLLLDVEMEGRSCPSYSGEFPARKAHDPSL